MKLLSLLSGTARCFFWARAMGADLTLPVGVWAVVTVGGRDRDGRCRNQRRLPSLHRLCRCS
jgi:hypothetical protein